MAAHADDLVTREIIATANNSSRRRTNELPAPDGLIPRDVHKPAFGWKISTVRAWNPAVADRCVRILEALKDQPNTAA